MRNGICSYYARLGRQVANTRGRFTRRNTLRQSAGLQTRRQVGPELRRITYASNSASKATPTCPSSLHALTDLVTFTKGLALGSYRCFANRTIQFVGGTEVHFTSYQRTEAYWGRQTEATRN